VGIALDDNAALEAVGDEYRIILSQPAGRAHHLVRRAGAVHTQALVPQRRFAPLTALFSGATALPNAD
jgi:hypothetical protein